MQKSQQEITLKKVNEAMKKVYFCPYCRNIFKNEMDYKCLKNNQFSSKQCSCTPFTRDTYKRHTDDKLSFSMNGTIDEGTIYNHIAKIVISFKKDGLSNDNIYKITYFPISIINRIVQESLPKDKSISIEEFLYNELELDEIICKKILNKGKLESSDEEDVIIKAIKYGCGRDFIVGLLHVNTGKISDQRKLLDLPNNLELNNFIKYNKGRRTLKLLNGKVFFTYGKKK